MNWKSRLQSALHDRQRRQLWRYRHTLDSPQGNRVIVDGRSLINFCSNDYLGLANDPALIEAGQQILSDWGSGSGASHLICGHNQLHHQLELRLASMVGAQRAIVFSTGYMANLAIPQSLLDRDDLIVQDKLNHASLIDAGMACKATMKRYPHGDYQRAEEILNTSTASKKMVMTDGVFSMDGDVADLDTLHPICQQQNAMLVVDDAHGFGVLGTTGAGSLQLHKIPVRQNVIMVGTLGKACGTFGAFVAGDEEIIETLIQQGRTYIYTTSLPPVVIGMTLAALDIIQHQPERRQRLIDNVQYFRQMASDRGIRLFPSNTPIQPIRYPEMIPTESSITNLSDTDLANGNDPSIRWALAKSEQLLAKGIWVSAIRPPTVPVGTARLRVTITANHTESEISQLVDAFFK